MIQTLILYLKKLLQSINLHLLFVTWLLPIFYLPVDLVVTIVKRAFCTSNPEADWIHKMNEIQVVLNDRMRDRKNFLFTDTMAILQKSLGDEPLRALEIGGAPGCNFSYYPPKTEVTCLGPSAAYEGAIKKVAENFPDIAVDFKVANLEDMNNLESASYDVIVSSLAFTSVKDELKCLREIRRVLKPGGKFIFLEQVGASKFNLVLYILQLLVNPVWKFIHNGNTLTSGCDRKLKKVGFSKLNIEHFSADAMLKPVPINPTIGIARSCICGVATN
jgi:SAM-dependent methyltransferase